MSQRERKSAKTERVDEETYEAAVAADVTASEALPEAVVTPINDGLIEVQLLDVNREFVESVRIDRGDRRFRIYRGGQQYHHVDTTGDDIWRYAPES